MTFVNSDSSYPGAPDPPFLVFRFKSNSCPSKCNLPRPISKTAEPRWKGYRNPTTYPGQWALHRPALHTTVHRVSNWTCNKPLHGHLTTCSIHHSIYYTLTDLNRHNELGCGVKLTNRDYFRMFSQLTTFPRFASNCVHVSDCLCVHCSTIPVTNYTLIAEHWYQMPNESSGSNVNCYPGLSTGG